MQFFFNYVKKNNTFLQKHVSIYEAVGGLAVRSSLLPHVLWGRSQVSLLFAGVVSPDIYMGLYLSV